MDEFIPDIAPDQGKIEFFDHKVPALQDGNYSLAVDLTYSTNDPEAPQSTWSTTASFYVAGPRYRLDPKEVYGKYPPENANASYRNVLPGIVFTRAALLWERNPGGPTGETAPWMALLVVNNTDQITPQVVQSTAANFGPPGGLESVDTGAEIVNVLQLPLDWCQTFVPAFEDLQWAASVRRSLTESGEVISEDKSQLMANRLPPEAGGCTVYLVSVEGRYDATGNFDFSQNTDMVGQENVLNFLPARFLGL